MGEVYSTTLLCEALTSLTREGESPSSPTGYDPVTTGAKKHSIILSQVLGRFIRKRRVARHLFKNPTIRPIFPKCLSSVDLFGVLS